MELTAVKIPIAISVTNVLFRANIILNVSLIPSLTRLVNAKKIGERNAPLPTNAVTREPFVITRFGGNANNQQIYFQFLPYVEILFYRSIQSKRIETITKFIFILAYVLKS